MIEAAFTDDLALLAGALRQEAFRFILINHNRKSIYTDIAQWLRSQYPDRPFFELEFRDKDYRRISDELTAIERGIVLVPDFDWLFIPENEALCIAFNQRRDFFARRPVALICFLQPSNFLLVPKKIPDWWSLRSLELEFQRELLPEDNLLQFQPLELEFSSLGGISAADKKAEIERLLRQIEVADTENLALLQSLYAQLGELYYALSEYKEAEEVFEVSLEIAKKMGDHKREGEILSNISEIYIEQGRHFIANQFAKRVLEIAKKIGSHQLEGDALYNIGSVLKAKGDYKNAVFYLKSSLKIKQKTGDQIGAGMALNGIGQIFSAQKNATEAIIYFEKSIQLFKKSGHLLGESIVLNNISLIFKDRGEYDKALNYLHNSLNLCRQIGSRSVECTILNNIGQTYYNQKDYKAAFRYLEESKKISQEIGKMNLLAINLTNIGIILFHQDHFERAITSLIEAYNIFKRLDVLEEVKVLEEHLAIILAQIGEARFKELAGEQASDFLNNLSQAE